MTIRKRLDANSRRPVHRFRTAMACLLALAGLSVQAAPVMSLKGTTDAVKYDDDREVRLSVLSFNEPDNTSAFVESYQSWVDNRNHEAFAERLASAQTRGYLFTQEATGYTIKYAWRENDDNSGRMVFVVTPALTSLNPYMWENPAEGEQPFTVLELDFDGEQGVLKTSLDAPVQVNSGEIRLGNFAEQAPFAMVRDDTPYYLEADS